MLEREPMTTRQHMERVIEQLQQEHLLEQIETLRDALDYIATHSRDEMAVLTAINALGVTEGGK